MKIMRWIIIDRHNRLPKKIIFSLLALSLIMMISINFFINDRINLLKEKFVHLNQTSLENISKNHISKELKNNENGFDYIYSTIEGRPVNKESIEEYYKRWEEYMIFTEDVSYLYLGTDTGYIYVRPKYTIGEDFIVSERPWYQAAIKSQGKKVWTIYNDYLTGEILLCLSRKIKLGKNRCGVLGMDVSKNKISSYLFEIVKNSKTENVFLMSESMVIYGEQDGPQMGKTILSRLRDESKNKSSGYFIEGDSYVFYNSIYIEKWKLVRLVKKNELEKELNSYIKSAEILFHFEILMIIMCIIYTVYRIRTPHGRDHLTGLKNRYLFDKILSKSDKKKGNYSIIFLDIDNFKLINDTFGHQTGDVVLKRIGKLIEEIMGPKDKAFRYGGEEFVVHSVRGKVETFHLGEEIRKQVEELNWREGFHITISVGIGVSKNDDSSLVLKRADTLLYNSKKQGKNRVSFEE